MRVLFLDLDTLRPDHLGCYGYHRDTSPNIDSIARDGVRYTNYHCSDAPCLPSRAALMTSRFGIHTGVVGHGGTAADMRLEGESRGFGDSMRRANLPTVFRNAGMRTVSVSPFAERHSAWWFYAGFNEILNTGRGGMESAEEITPTALDWLDRNAADDNWFLHVNYWDPHTPYRAPGEFGNPFGSEPLPAWFTPELLAAHRAMVGPHDAREIMMYSNEPDPRYPRHPGELRDMDDLRRMVDGYDCGIRYMDAHIGQLLDRLRGRGVLDDVAVIVSADHGENMGELGIYGEHATADLATTRIPMILKWPGCDRGATDAGLHYNLDLAPTLADLLGTPSDPIWDGLSYAPSLRSRASRRAPGQVPGQAPRQAQAEVGVGSGRPYLVVSQCAHVCQRGVRFDEWMYVRTYHDGFHLFDDEMLFNVADDPHETTNLAGQRRDICREAVYMLNEWHDAMMKSMDSDIDPLWTVMREGGPLHARNMGKRYAEFLERTDRAWAVPELKRRHPREFR